MTPVTDESDRYVNTDSGQHLDPALHVIQALRCRWHRNLDPVHVLERVVRTIEDPKHPERPERFRRLLARTPWGQDDFFSDLEGAWQKVTRSFHSWKTAAKWSATHPRKFDPAFRQGYGDRYHRFLGLLLALAYLGEFHKAHGRCRVPLPQRKVADALGIKRSCIKHYVAAAQRHDWLRFVKKAEHQTTRDGRRTPVIDGAVYEVARVIIRPDGSSWPTWL